MATTKQAPRARSNGNAKVTSVEVGKLAQIGPKPWSAEFTIQGSSSLLFHRFIADEGDGPSARKGARPVSDPEDCLFRCEDGTIGMPGEYVRQSMIHAAKYRKDPRSPRASAFGLFKAAVVMDTELSSLGVSEFDYVDRRRVVIKGAITRIRPAFQAGWRATFSASVLLPEYVDSTLMLDVLNDAGRFVGVGDFRPSFGRFSVVSFTVTDE